jgi:uncharacterized protein YodC (DUF2158 family)
MENKRKFAKGDKVKLKDGDGTILTVVDYTIDFVTLSIEAIESALGDVPVQELVKCEWVAAGGETKEDVFREDALSPA